MAAYIFIFHHGEDDDFAVITKVEHQFRDDLDALEAAQRLAEEFAVDVWSGETLVAQVKKGNEALSIEDSHSG